MVPGGAPQSGLGTREGCRSVTLVAGRLQDSLGLGLRGEHPGVVGGCRRCLLVWTAPSVVSSREKHSQNPSLVSTPALAIVFAFFFQSSQ